MITLLIVLLTAGLSIWAFSSEDKLYKFILTPYRLNRDKNYYTLLTSGFIHADWMHLLFNMIAFYSFGRNLEYTVGPIRFLLFYLGTILITSAISWRKNIDNPYYRTLGASGGVCGVLFATILFYPGMSLYMMFIPIPIPGVLYAVLYLLYTFYASKNSEGSGINHDAHLWGALCGVAFALLLDPEILRRVLGRIFGGE
ncbi:rhomboid family intramembrane serine protease [Leptospira gomenensis]|uniref:Rhomboid family intramembrane serine protease n=1 Tax=Leptospira gomenensis TaxID=2484974 RepID=A0A5F1YBC7_9LEPT|nr:rhomboid family intramembrane serine protease [Leptospira gomenensis]TGK34662.1 rhomboid family intramembrane serine protease [Leptospira gomenensis]TGK38531.1 rhomboid family intramembrane serine protease [Leptospira gomenensis]TGK51041.1 rhomboid family intramembrane serine protease [Leptospira gomenensis]TGK68318.1 rhomboid family intramembrane serine protease [Leptospira gomenensis]